MGQLKHLFSLIRFSHTLFALPFALASMIVASQGTPTLKTFLLILACMVTGRTAGMAFNRYLDAEIDARNPRTADREIPRGIVSRKFSLGLSIASAVLFVLATYGLNRLCFLLSPIALFILYFYSYTKRFTLLSHLFIGLALGISPVGAWIAVTGAWAWEPVILGLGVTFWVAGFDIIYATQDEAFDKKEGLHSLVVRFGVPKALWLSRLFHLTALLLFFFFGQIVFSTLSPFTFHLSLALCATLMIYEHRLVKPHDLSRVNAAFFNMNGYIAIIFLAGVVVSVLP